MIQRSTGRLEPRGTQPGAAAAPPYPAAAVAIGASSVHFTACVVDGHDLTPLADESLLLGLGAIVDRFGEVPPDVRAELTALLVRYSQQAADLGCRDLTLVTTEPLRRAANADVVRDEVERATGRPIFVLSHEEEGLLALLGHTHGMPPSGEELLVDIGGGSTEYVASGPGHPPLAAGLPIGAARLTEAFLAHDPPTRDEVEALRAAARLEVARAGELRPAQATFVGGTASNLVRIVPASRSDRVLTGRRLSAAREMLLRDPSDAVAARFGIHPARARILPGGAAIVEAFLRHCRLPRAVMSEASVREGVILAVTRSGPGWRERIAELAAGWEG